MGERAMLYFLHTHFVCPLLLQLILPMALIYCGVLIARCVWVENPDIKECTLSIPPPEALCHNVKSGTIFTVGISVLKQLSSYRL